MMNENMAGLGEQFQLPVDPTIVSKAAGDWAILADHLSPSLSL
jgi:hypothetical protein